MNIANGAVTSAKLAASAVDSTALADSALTLSKSPNALLAGIALNVNANVKACSLSRISIGATGAVPVSGTVNLCPVYLTKGTVVSAISISSILAATTPTTQIVGLYNFAGTSKLAESADKTTEIFDSAVFKTFDMLVPYTVPTSGIYLVAILVCFTATLTLAKIGTTMPAGVYAGLKNGTADSGVTALPATLGTITETGTTLFVEIT